MSRSEVSLRQVTVLTVAALLAPGVDLLPGATARASGATGWLAPLLMLPILLLWVAALSSLLADGRDLRTALRQGLGPFLGRTAILLYILWGVLALSAQLARSSARLGVVYGTGVGQVLALLPLLLALWTGGKGPAALCRTGELFWLALGVSVVAITALSLPQMKLGRLWPAWREWGGLPRAGLVCLGAAGPAVFGAALAGGGQGGRKSRRRLLGWTAVLCGLLTLLLGVIAGQVGVQLTAKLNHPFFIMVQGLSLEGAVARLEALVGALWLMADFCYAGLLLAGMEGLVGERAGRAVMAATAVIAALGQGWLSWEWGVELGGLILGVGLPLILWCVCKVRKGG